MKIKYKHGLLLVDVMLNYSGKSKQIKNMVLDTGAARTLISQDAVDDIGLQVGFDDRIVTYFGIGGKEYAFRKNIDNIQIGDYVIKNIEVDFNDFGYEDIKGLLGLDLLIQAGFTIDLLHLEMNRKK